MLDPSLPFDELREKLEMLRDASEYRAAKASDDGTRVGLDELVPERSE